MIKDKEKVYWFIKRNGIYYVIAVLSLLIIAAVNYINFFSTGEYLIDFMDWTVFFAITISLMLEKASSLISNVMLKKYEDSAKTTQHYAELVKRYSLSGNGIGFIEYDNAFAADENLHYIEKAESTKIKFPVTCDYVFTDKAVSINDEKDKFYTLPELLKDHVKELLECHNQSNVYNQMTIRVDSWEEKPDAFHINTSRTTYYDSLMTNRAVDYKWKNSMSVRDIFQYGPFMPQLNTSVLSNHLGYNGFVISADGYIPFVKRHDDVSIGKDTYGCSIGASMKVKYALDDNSPLLTKEGIIKSIYSEIYDEIKIIKEQLKSIAFGENIICAYRDIVEGGKPQLLFWVESTSNMKEIDDQFKEELKKAIQKKKSYKYDKELKELEDGYKLLWIKADELKKLVILPEGIVHKGRFYSMLPTVTASIVMLLDWQKKRAQD